MKNIAASLICSFLVATPSFAQESDDEILMSPIVLEISAGADSSEYFSRCAGLFVSIFEWAGPSRLGEENANGIRDLVGAITHREIQRNVESGVGEEEATTKVESEIRDEADQYIRHFSGLEAVFGTAFTSDGLLQSDTAFCQQLVSGQG